MTAFARFERIPPCLCRLLARTSNGRRALSHREIAERSGLPNSTVADYSFRTSFKGIPIDVAERFALGCGVDHLHAERQMEYARRCLDENTPPAQRRKMAYLEAAPPAQRIMLLRLFVLCRKLCFSPRK